MSLVAVGLQIIGALWVVAVGALLLVVLMAIVIDRQSHRRARVQTSAPSAPLLPPDGNWCGCCGRPKPPPWRWCGDCLFHVRMDVDAPDQRTWSAQHGTVCPFTDLDDDAAIDDVARRPSRVSPGAEWSAADRDLFDEIRHRVTP